MRGHILHLLERNRVIDLLGISRLVLLGLPVADRRQAGFQRKGQFIDLLRFFLRISRSCSSFWNSVLPPPFSVPQQPSAEHIHPHLPGKLRRVNIDGVVPAVLKIRHHRGAHGALAILSLLFTR